MKVGNNSTTPIATVKELSTAKPISREHGDFRFGSFAGSGLAAHGQAAVGKREP